MVDKSLSRGLADHVLDELKGLTERYAAECRRILSGIPHKRHGVQSILNRLTVVGERCLLTQVVGGHPRWRWASTCAFIPEVESAPGSERNRSINFRAARTYVHINRVPQGGLERAVVLTVQEHAVERLFLRLNVLDAAAVREEMHDAMCLAVPVLSACAALGLKQVALPTRSGAFLCSIDGEHQSLIAKTWIPKSNEPGRHTAVVGAIDAYYTRAGGEQAVGMELISIPYDMPLTSHPAADEFVAALAPFSWLKDPYSPRRDPVGAAWRGARSHAHALEEFGQ